MPVDRDGFHAPMLFGGIDIFAGVVPYHKQKDQACENVEGVHTSHDIKNAAHWAIGRIAKTGNQTFRGGQSPFNGDYAYQKAETQEECDHYVIEKAFGIAMRHGGFTAIHKERREK